MIMPKKRSGIGQRRKKTKKSRVVSPQDTRHNASHTKEGKRVSKSKKRQNKSGVKPHTIRLLYYNCLPI